MTREEYDKLPPWQQGRESFRSAGTNPEIPDECPFPRTSGGCSLWYAGWAAGHKQQQGQQCSAQIGDRHCRLVAAHDGPHQYPEAEAKP